jgi:DNA-binding LacI/PurR family transcriptional regulator
MSLPASRALASLLTDGTVRTPYSVTVDTRPVGLVLARSPKLFGVEPFSMELIGGIEEVLTAVDRPLLMQVVPNDGTEQATYRRWVHDHAVAAVVLMDLTVDDPRLALVHELALPSVALASTASHLTSPHVAVDGGRTMREAVGELVALGHRRIAQVSGPEILQHTRERTETFIAECRRSGVAHQVVVGDYTEGSGATATRRLLEGDEPPTGIVFDNDVMAIAGLGVAREHGLDVPRDLSIIAWDDSTLCRLAVPPLSAMSLDVHELGRQVGACVLAVLAGKDPGGQPAPAHQFVARGSTGPAPRPESVA